MFKLKFSKAFSIIEVLIVVVVLAIISTVSIVVYGSVSENAKTIALPNSLQNAKKEIEESIVISKSNKLTTLPPAVKADSDVVLSLAGSADGNDGFCVNAYRISKYEVASLDSKYGKVNNFLCPGVLTGSPVGGTVPNVPKNVNIMTPLSEWKLTGAVTYNSSSDELVFNGSSGVARSPLIRVDGSDNVHATHQVFSNKPAVQFSPSTGSLMDTFYYAADGTTPVMNGWNYPSNGNAVAVPVSQWGNRSWLISTGPNVKYMVLSISAHTTHYTSDDFRIRSVRLEAR